MRSLTLVAVTVLAFSSALALSSPLLSEIPAEPFASLTLAASSALAVLASLALLLPALFLPAALSVS